MDDLILSFKDLWHTNPGIISIIALIGMFGLIFLSKKSKAQLREQILEEREDYKHDAVSREVIQRTRNKERAERRARHKAYYSNPFNKAFFFLLILIASFLWGSIIYVSIANNSGQGLDIVYLLASVFTTFAILYGLVIRRFMPR